MTEQREPMDVPKTDQALPAGRIIQAALDIWGQVGERHIVPITGNSMLPFIQAGDRVLVAHGCTSIRRGDVVVFRREGHMIAHRAMCIYDSDAGSTFVTKGDNTLQFDPPLSAERIVGRVLAVERGKRHMSLDSTSWRLLGWLIAVGTLLWTRMYAWSRALKRRLLGPRPNRVAAALRRSALTTLSLALRTMQAFACRWEDSALDLSGE